MPSKTVLVLEIDHNASNIFDEVYDTDVERASALAKEIRTLVDLDKEEEEPADQYTIAEGTLAVINWYNDMLADNDLDIHIFERTIKDVEPGTLFGTITVYNDGEIFVTMFADEATRLAELIERSKGLALTWPADADIVEVVNALNTKIPGTAMLIETPYAATDNPGWSGWADLPE